MDPSIAAVYIDVATALLGFAGTCVTVWHRYRANQSNRRSESYRGAQAALKTIDKASANVLRRPHTNAELVEAALPSAIDEIDRAVRLSGSWRTPPRALPELAIVARRMLDAEYPTEASPGDWKYAQAVAAARMQQVLEVASAEIDWQWGPR